MEYTRTPPQIFISQLRKFVRDHQHPPGCHLSLEWVKAPEEPTAKEELQRTDHGNCTINTYVHVYTCKCACCTVYRHPKGYKHNPRCPELREITTVHSVFVHRASLIYPRIFWNVCVTHIQLMMRSDSSSIGISGGFSTHWVCGEMKSTYVENKQEQWGMTEGTLCLLVSLRYVYIHASWMYMYMYTNVLLYCILV